MSDRHRRLAAALPEPWLPRVADLGCGDGRTLAALRERLGNDPDTEWGVVAEELRQITRLRLERLLRP